MLSDSSLRGKALPKALPLDAAATSARAKSDSDVSLSDVLGRSRPAARSPRQSGEVRVVPRRNRKSGPSKWVWIGIVAVAILRVAGLLGDAIPRRPFQGQLGARPTPPRHRSSRTGVSNARNGPFYVPFVAARCRFPLEFRRLLNVQWNVYQATGLHRDGAGPRTALPLLFLPRITTAFVDPGHAIAVDRQAKQQENPYLRGL